MEANFMSYEGAQLKVLHGVAKNIETKLWEKAASARHRKGLETAIPH